MTVHTDIHLDTVYRTCSTKFNKLLLGTIFHWSKRKYVYSANGWQDTQPISNKLSVNSRLCTIRYI